jgi:hypothetical protein
VKTKELIAKAKAKKPATNPNGHAEGLVPYRFKKGQVANPLGGAARQKYVSELTGRMMRSSPPKELCAQIGVDPSVTWAEAILFSLSKAAAQGDVAAAREVLAALGFSGTQSKNILAVQNNVDAGSATEFLRRSHGLSEDSLQTVYKFMDSLPREAPVVDASYFPDEDQQ